MRYWLLKSEPEAYSIDDLKRDRVGRWDGVRNYTARNNLRAMKKGDLCLFYHSSTKVIGVAGAALVEREAYPDPTQFDPKSPYYDPKSKRENPRWSAVDLRFKAKFKEVVTLEELKNDPSFKEMLVVRPGIRLSVMPVSKKHFDRILKLGTKGEE